MGQTAADEHHHMATSHGRRCELVPRLARSLPQVGELDAGREPLPKHPWSPAEHEEVPVIMLQMQVNEFYEVRVMRWRGG